MAAKLERQQQKCLLIGDRHGELELEQILTGEKIDRIIYLAGLDTSATTIAEINHYQQQHCGNVLNLIRALIKNAVTVPIWFATRANQVENDLEPSAIASSCLWGLATAIAVEHSEYWGGIVDLDREPVEGEADSLLKVIAHQGREDRLAIRQDRVYVPRLDRTKVSSSQTAITADGCYLITGGLGSLGLQVARWLAEKGAKNLLLLGRSQPSAQATQAIARLEQQGVTVNVAQADITNYAALKNALETSAIRGVIHAAGILDDGLLQGQTWERFERVISPKVTGAWNLHLCTKDLQLDFFVLFSSMAALIGSPGQSNYSVANTGLDAIARYRRSLNLPALSINWGAWADGGMAVERGFKVEGLNLIEPEAGLSALEQLLSTELTQVGVMERRLAAVESKIPLPTAVQLLRSLGYSLRRPGYTNI